MTRGRSLATLRTGTAACLAVLVGASAAMAAEAPAKRKEGRYFVELAEIMLTTEDFDIDVATVDPGGPADGGPTYEQVADLSSWSAEAPMITIGLNRPSGKTTFSFTVFDFDRMSAFQPVDFDDDSNIITPHYVPPGIVFMRQAVPPTSAGNRLDDDYIPNYAIQDAFVRRIDFRSGDLTLEHNIVENKKLRLRWIGGLKYAQLEQELAVATAYAKEFSAVSNRNVDFQDFCFVNSRIETHGLGPKFGLAGRWLLDEKKKWSFDGRIELAAIPEKTIAIYEARLVDSSGEEFVLTSPTFSIRQVIDEAPVIPGAGEPYALPAIQAGVRQDDFTKLTWLATGRIGVRFKPKDFFTVGLDAWQMRWMGVLSQPGIFDAIHEQGRFVYANRGSLESPDPQLADVEVQIHVPRFTQRQDFVFDGVSLNLTFDF